MKKIVLCFILLFLSACAARNPLSDFRFQTVMAPPYVVVSWFKIDAPSQPLRIYIEGDGIAYTSNGVVSENPTPTDTFLRQMAAKDPNPNVIYLARPCQYLQAGACTGVDWTTGRYSNKIVDSMEEAVHMLMKKARTDKVVLIGYDGGAQIAGLIAVRLPSDNVQVITIGGILDQQAWTEYHGHKPLIHSMNLADYKKRYNKIEQHHFVGAKDTVVPMSLTEDFVLEQDRITVVPKAMHEKGFESISKEIYQMRQEI